MALNQYIVRTDGLFGIKWDRDTSADLQTLRQSYLDSQLTQIIHGLKALDGENLELYANIESGKMYRSLYEKVQPMLITGQCDEKLMTEEAGLYLLFLKQVSESSKRLRDETSNLPPPPQKPPPPPPKSPPPKSPPPKPKPPPPKPKPPPPMSDYQTTPPDQPRMDFYIPYSPPPPKYIVALPGAPPGAPPPPPPPPPAKTAQNVVPPKTEPIVPTRRDARSKEPAPLTFDSELANRLLRRRNAVNGPDSSSSSRVFKPSVITQNSPPREKLMGEAVAVVKYKRPANDDTVWSDSD